MYSNSPRNLPDYTLTSEELGRLSETHIFQKQQYRVWGTRNDILTAEEKQGDKVIFTPRPTTVQLAEDRPGMYLVDPDTGKLAYLMDPTIMGQLHEQTRHLTPGTKIGHFKIVE